MKDVMSTAHMYYAQGMLVVFWQVRNLNVQGGSRGSRLLHHNYPINGDESYLREPSGRGVNLLNSGAMTTG